MAADDALSRLLSLQAEMASPRSRRMRMASGGSALHCTHDAESVGPEDFGEIGFRISALEEGGGDEWEVGCGVDSFRWGGDSVEVGTNANMFWTNYLQRMVKVIDEGIEGRSSDEGRPFAIDSVGGFEGDWLVGEAEGGSYFFVAYVALRTRVIPGCAPLLVDEGRVEVDVDCSSFVGDNLHHFIS